MKSKFFFIVISTLFIFHLIPFYALAEEPLTLETSIDIALKNSIVLDSAKEGVNVATAQKREAITFPAFHLLYLQVK